MPSPSTLDVASELIDQAQRVIDGAVRQLKDRGGPDQEQSLAYDVAHAASAIATARACLSYAQKGATEAALASAFLGLALADLCERVLGREALWGVEHDWFAPFASFVVAQR